MSEYDYEPSDDEIGAMSDQEFDSYLASIGADEDDDYEDTGPPGLPYLESTISDATRAGLQAGLAPLQQLAEEQARSDEYWQERQAAIDYEQHVQEQAALAEAQVQAHDLIAQAGEQFDCRTSAANGTVEAWANQYLVAAQQAAFDAGDTDALERLQGPEGAHAAIQAAAVTANLEAVKNRALRHIEGRR